MFRFLATFGLLLLGLFGVELLQPVQDHFVLPWTALLARGCSLLASFLDPQVYAQGKVLMNPATGFGVSIEPGCNGIEACAVLIAALFAFPAPWRHRLLGLLVGLVAVQGINVVRIISLFYLGQWNMAAFSFAHEYLWQGLIMLDVLVVWLLWVRANPERPSADRHEPA